MEGQTEKKKTSESAGRAGFCTAEVKAQFESGTPVAIAQSEGVV